MKQRGERVRRLQFNCSRCWLFKSYLIEKGARKSTVLGSESVQLISTTSTKITGRLLEQSNFNKQPFHWLSLLGYLIGSPNGGLAVVGAHLWSG